jgi:predicted dehydrogenase
MKKIRWGMIGCGNVTEVKSGPAFYKARNSELVAVMRRNGALAQDYAKRHNVPRWYDNADAIIDASDIDAVYIATHTNTHRDYALRCLAAGKPTYVEKPMAMSYAECVEMIDAARRHEVPLWVGYFRRALPRFLKVKELIEQGAIGAVRMTISRQFAQLLDPVANPQGHLLWRLDPKLSGGGLFFEGVCHTFDFLQFLFGPIEEMRGFATNMASAYRGEDTINASYRFASGVQGSGAWCFDADSDYETNEIIGTKGRIQFSIFTAPPIKLIRGENVEEFPEIDPPHWHQPLVQTIVDELNGSGKCPSTGETASRTAWVMDQLLSEHRRSPESFAKQAS